MAGEASLVRGNAARLPLANESVDLVIASPPYFLMRDYEDDGGSLPGQLGGEPTPADYLAGLWDVMSEVRRVMKPGASAFWNMGDKYVERAGPGRQARYLSDQDRAPWRKAQRPARRGVRGVRAKSLLGLPWSFALGCTGMLEMLGGPTLPLLDTDPDALPLILRAEIVWNKPNALPESVFDRVARSHETWFHFTKQPRYGAGLDDIREAYSPATAARYAAGYGDRSGWDAQRVAVGVSLSGDGWEQNPLGKVPRSVWEIPTESLVAPAYFMEDETRWSMMSAGAVWRYVDQRVRCGILDPVRVGEIDHFASFPTEWPRRLIKGWSPAGVCVECGQGRWPTVGTDCEQCGAFRPNNAKRCDACGHRRAWKEGRVASKAMGAGDFSTPGHGTPRKAGRHTNRSTSRGPRCACPTPDAPTRPAVVLDPFSGTGTTALAARALGRYGVGVDLSMDYVRLSRWRVFESTAAQKVAARDHAEAQGALW